MEERFNLGTWSWDLETSAVTWSPGLFKIIGLDPSTVIPTLDLYQSLIHPDDQLDFSNAIGLAMDKRLEDRTFRIIRPDGGLRWLRSKAQPHFGRDGRAVAVFGVIMDVTEIVQFEFRFNEELVTRQALEQLLGGHIWRAYPDGKLIETTEWTKLTGQTPSEARDWEKLAAIHPDDRQIFRDAWASALANGRRFEVSIRAKSSDGVYVRMMGKAVAVRDGGDKIREWIGFTHFEGQAPIVPSAQVRLTAAQIRAARALVNWSVNDLAEKARISFSTIRRMEASTSSARSDKLLKVRNVLEAEGVRFFVGAEGAVSVGLIGS